MQNPILPISDVSFSNSKNSLNIRMSKCKWSNNSYFRCEGYNTIKVILVAFFHKKYFSQILLKIAKCFIFFRLSKC